MCAPLYPWQQTRAPSSHASIREVRELHLSSGVCHQSHTSERGSSDGFSLFLRPRLRSARAWTGGFACQTMLFHTESATIAPSRNGWKHAGDFRFGGGGCGNQPPCALLIQASLRSIRLLIMRHECKWYNSQAIRDPQKRKDKDIRVIVMGVESRSVQCGLTVREPCAITASYIMRLWKLRAAPNGHRGLIMTTLLLAYSIIHDFLITAAIRNRGGGGRAEEDEEEEDYICGGLACRRGWRQGEIRRRQLAEQQFTLILCCVWWMWPERGWAADGEGWEEEEEGGG